MLNKSVNRLAIGTVQFGMNYGISNKNGQPSLNEIKKILDLALQNDIDMLDTAVGYGESEKRLGETGITGWQVVTKLPAVADECQDVAGWVEKVISESLERLKISRLYGILFHTPSQLLDKHGTALYNTVQRLKKNGIVDKIGISIYSPDELEPLFNKFDFEIVQAPFNIFDRRLSESGWLKKLSAKGVEIHVRSIFLQGLLLMHPNRPPFFNTWDQLWQKYDTWLTKNNLTHLNACLNHVLAYPEINKLVVGVDNVVNIREIIEAVNPGIGTAPEDLICNDLELINPSHWPAS